MKEYQSLSHTRWDCKYHVVFIPKRRKKAIFGALRKHLGAVFRELARHKESEVVEGHLRPDHVHMCLSIPPKYAVANVVGYMKGKSAIAIARRFAGRARNFTGEVFWARGYFVSTVGLDEEMVRAYIRNQQVEDERYDQIFALERELLKLVFPQMWDKLTEQQRKDLLAKLDPNGTIKDKAGIAAMSGASALAVLSTTVAFTGFAFYTTMSVTIGTAAAAVGVTLPMATYTTASSLVGILSGPVGWAIVGVATLGGLALAGRANLQKTAALIGQIHVLKVEALIAAGVREQDVSNA